MLFSASEPFLHSCVEKNNVKKLFQASLPNPNIFLTFIYLPSCFYSDFQPCPLRDLSDWALVSTCHTLSFCFILTFQDAFIANDRRLYGSFSKQCSVRNINDRKCLLMAKQQTVGNSGLLIKTCYSLIILFHLFNYFGKYCRKM